MNYKIFNLIIISLILGVGSILYQNTQLNIVRNSLVYWGAGWQNQQSAYAGSEIGLNIENSNNISIDYTRNSKANQGIEVTIDGKKEPETSTDPTNEVLTFSLSETSAHTIVLRYYCTYLYDLCDITINKILVERKAKLHPYQTHKPILSVLGDSISTIYGNHNYSWLVSESQKYQLHNASIMGSTVSRVQDVDSAISRYQKDLKPFASAKTVIFLGTNDAKNNVPLSTFENDYSHMIVDILGWNKTTQLFLIGILPRRDIDVTIINEYNSVIKNLAQQYNIHFVDSSDWITYSDLADDIHPSVESQKKIFDNFQQIFSINE